MGKFVDITGQRFGRWTVIKRSETIKKQTTWLCKCDCGTIKSVRGSDLKSGKSVSCGCFNKEVVSEKSVKDLTNMKFGRLTVIERVGSDKHGKALWLCQCDCGNETVVNGTRLSDGRTQSCGCLQKERTSEAVKKAWDNDEHYREQHSGSHHHKYNPDITDEERVEKRKFKAYYEWQFTVKEQGNFTCDICGNKQGGNLVSHHLDCYSKYKNKRLDVSNGVCLCKHCHEEFHSYMGGTVKPCTADDYYKWKQLKQEEFDSKAEDVA